jgi:DNA-binding response OmpR family regulator
MYKITIIEDAVTIREELQALLSRYGYLVSAPASFDNILEFLQAESPDLVLLDINLPVFDGYYICQEIRKRSNVPIIVVTSRDTEMDELMSMNLGADDYITKPYNTQILLARVNTLLRRVYEANHTQNEILVYSDLKLNLSNGVVSYGDKSQELTKNEFRILACLIKNKGKIISRNDLMEYMWDADVFVDDNTLSVNMTRLRKKLDELGMREHIETRRGLGYILP